MLDALESVLSPLLSVVPYVLLKFVAYAAWCFVGLRRHQPTLTRNQLASRAVGWGLFRLGLGLIFGTGIFLAQATVGGWARSPGVGGVVRDVAVYLAVYVPVRRWWCGGLDRGRHPVDRCARRAHPPSGPVSVLRPTTSTSHDEQRRARSPARPRA